MTRQKASDPRKGVDAASMSTAVALQSAGANIRLNSLRLAALCLTTIVLSTAALGWLYWLRIATTKWPGPRMLDALPLDELAGHAGVPTVIFVASFGAASLLIGLVGRMLSFDRLTGGFCPAVCVGLWLLAVDTVCLYAVRQSSLSAAFHGAVSLQPIYVAAAVAGLCGALLGRHAVRDKWNRVLAWAVGVAGVLDLVSAIIPPGNGLGHIAALAPSFVPISSALAVPVGVILILCARVLARGNMWAYRLSVTLLGVSSVLHLLRSLDYPAAAVTAAVAVALVARRESFRSPADPAARSQSVSRLLAMLVIVFAYGITALVTNRIVADLPVNLPLAVVSTAQAMVGVAPRDSAYFVGTFGEWFPWSVVSLVAVGVGWAAAPWFAPWRQRLLATLSQRERARQLVRKYGNDTLAPFALRRDKDKFFFREPHDTADGAADEVLIAYRAVRGVALMTGDPIGPPESVPAAVDAFLAHIRTRGWRPAVLGASSRYLELYHRAGLREIYHGDEAVLDVGSFSLQGGRMKSVRQAANRVERNGFVAEMVPAGAADPRLRQQLREVERQWMGTRPRTGFVMELDDLFSLDGDDAVFAVARNGDGEVVAFLHLAVCHAGRSLSLSSPPRLADLPNGVIAWLVTKAVEYAKCHHYEVLSLNFSPLAALLGSEEDSIRRRLEKDLLFILKSRLSLQLDNLLLFNRRFNPVWRPRYVIFERVSDLPRIIVAAMAAEGYIPFYERIRGRDWTAASEIGPSYGETVESVDDEAANDDEAASEAEIAVP